jgi:DNA modification methylase
MDESRRLILAVDFDGVLHDPNNVKEGYKMGLPVAGAAEAVAALHNAGHRIVVHTIWATTEAANKAIADWLGYFKIPYDVITSMKPKADLYIDDHGYHFTDWKKTLEDINGTN